MLLVSYVHVNIERKQFIIYKRIYISIIVIYNILSYQLKDDQARLRTHRLSLE